MSDRSELKKSILLCGESDTGKFPRTFHIRETISSGGSAICYSARYENSLMGTLKEFYPMDVHSLYRDENGQLVHHPDMPEEKEKFSRLLAEYIEPYKMLLEARKNEHLAAFIPPFEIYYGCDEHLNPIGTVYIWSPSPKVETFKKLCEEIHEHPEVEPEHKLVHALYSIESLTKCILALHSANLLHRDIKPENFGFTKIGSEIQTQNVSLFDIDTICSVYHVPDGICRGTEGFIEPEFTNQKANNLTDIYAIGATLFYAVIVNDNNTYYQSRLYPELRELVNNSKLIRASETNSHPHLRSILTQILQKTLCPRDDRYQSCEELLADVRKALYYVVPAEIADRGNAGERWILADIDLLNALDAKQEKNSTLALQYHLYMNPLYMNVPAEQEKIRVLLIGFGKYAQKFMDIALQISQMPGKYIEMTVISSSQEDKSVYLAERPELSRFFNIDGSLPEDKESYGSIQFIKHMFSTDNAEENQKFLADIPADYVFIATGKDSRNLMIAQTLHFSCTHTVLENIRMNQKEQNGLIPVYVTEDISKYPFYAELERMAFNVHLIWHKNLNIPFEEVRKDYRKPYNHDSCVSFVLSMKYKLHGIGIEMDSDSLEKTAKRYLSFILSHQSAKNELIYLEHRRWVAEKLCLGYRQITNLDECANGKPKDEKHQRHACIVRSRPEQVLSSKKWLNPATKKPDKEKWDNPSEEALSKLDELERMSVELHLMYRKHAKLEKENHLLHGDIVTAIRNQIDIDVTCVVAFQELLTCMKDIWDMNSDQVNRYEGLKKHFIRHVKDSSVIPERNQKSIEAQLKSLDKQFYPIWASQKYWDYKQDDIALIHGIPFILTYSDACMVIPYMTGNNTKLFDNLASATAVNPVKIIYAAFCASPSELSEIKATVPYIANYMERKVFRADVEFIIGYPEKTDFGSLKETEQDFRSLSKKRISRVKFIPAESRRNYAAALKEYLHGRSRKKMNFLLEQNESPLSCVMEGAGIFEDFSSYSYDSVNMKFTVAHGCDFLKYLRVKPHITVADMFAFQLSSSKTSNKPEFYADYKELFEKYRLNTGAWKFMCKLFKEYSEQNEQIAFFKQENFRKGTEKEHRYIVPFFCRKAIVKILNALIEQEIAGKDSGIISMTTDSCIVTIKDSYGYKKEYDELFSKLHLLMNPDYLYCMTNPKLHTVKILYNNLTVSNLDCKTLQANGYDLIDYLHQKHYLINLNCDRTAKKVSFTYATPQIKDLLTLEGRILEIYVYHKARETGGFDDIRSSFEIDWAKSLATNEFDCVLTKGFSVLFIECKATKEIKTEFYMKISTLVRKFGINATAVLIADTQDTPDSAPVNDIQREKGKQFDVVTISDRREIINIGNTLLKLIEN